MTPASDLYRFSIICTSEAFIRPFIHSFIHSWMPLTISCHLIPCHYVRFAFGFWPSYHILLHHVTS